MHFPGAWGRLGTKVELHCLIATGRFRDALRLVGRLCADDEDLHNAVPLRTLLDGKTWEELRSFSSRTIAAGRFGFVLAICRRNMARNLATKRI